jgi:pimeloyl-ACP methyl ester carboxylesterase
MKKVFPEVRKELPIEDIYLAGQSYGGATVLETMANLRMSNKASPLIKGLICLDAWFFPLSATTYQNLHNENLLLLNS